MHERHTSSSQNYLLAVLGVELVTNETFKGTMPRKLVIDRSLGAVITLMDKRGIINPRKSAGTGLAQITLEA